MRVLIGFEKPQSIHGLPLVVMVWAPGDVKVRGSLPCDGVGPGIHTEILAWGGRDQVHAGGGGFFVIFPVKKIEHM